MAKKTEIFLVSGQFLRRVDGMQQLSPEIEQCVVVAPDDKAAYDALAVSEPSFRPLGFVSLDQYDRAASQIRATVSGENTEWKLLVAPGMAS